MLADAADGTSGREPLFALPSGDSLVLELAPRKTSWDANSAGSKIALNEYLDYVTELAAPRLAELGGDLALRLDVGLAAGVDALHEHDLDNFLHPIIDRLGGRRFVSAWATKAPGAASLLRVERALPAGAEDGWQRWSGRTTVSTAKESEWKDEVKAALAGARELPGGPVGVQISLTVHPDRSWPNLWKMAIDGLDPLLGRSFPDDEYDPKDGRVVRLGIHVREDPAAGWDVPFVIRARPASLDWPEMAWLAAMSANERGAWLVEHERRWAPNRPSRRGSRPGTGATRRPGDASDRAATLAVGVARVAGAGGEITELRTVESFRAALAAGGPLVITDSSKPAKLHRSPGACSGVSEANFTGKVIERGGRNGRYYTTPDDAVARGRWPRLTVCGTCG